MKYRKFSDLGWSVSEVGLGCWQIGGSWGKVTEKDARGVLKKAIDMGVNFFDTSDMYGDGRSEKFLGEIIKSSKDDLYVTTKLGRRWRPNYPKGYKQEYLEEFIDRSLMNLGVDQIQLLQLHCPPSELCCKKETYEVLDDIVSKGKIANYGVSVWKISDAFEAIKFPNVKSIQLVFNIFRQKPAETFFKEAKKKNIAIIARGPLASGLLTGTINCETKFDESDHRNYNIDGKAFDIGDTFAGVDMQKGLLVVEELRQLLPAGFSLSDLALKWILMRDEVSVVIPGAVHKSEVKRNACVSHLEEIPSDILLEIQAIYNNFLKPDVHHRW